MKSFVSYLIFAMLALTSLPAFAENPAPEKLAHEMGARITRIPEFEFIREEAEKLGVRVYLFGGTAAAYGHYVRQDLAREAGDKRYPDFLYDYDYTNIFRSTQDLDVVVDGSAEKAEELEALLKQKFPHFVGDKAAKWEVRPLRAARGDKEAILNNPDFQNQHTDSHSTGMVEVTPASKGESAVKDVRDWNAKEPQFLKDVAEQKLHYYFNPLHETTKRAKEGLNPSILSAVRYLTKAFQYDLQIPEEDLTKIRAIIDGFSKKDLKNDYVKSWMEKNGKKLFQHAVDLEYAWNTLESLGLRKKLISLQKNPKEIDSLAWWMNKEPLRTHAIGKGAGKTAAELLGKDLVVAHETNSFLAYESITRSKAGDLNAFISRKEAEDAGESALGGDGFYTAVGRAGARDTGFTIRMQVDPHAREGSDFIYNPEAKYLILRNRAAVKVIPEQISLSLPAYFKLLAQGKEFSEDDRALLEAFKRRTGRVSLVSAQELEEVVDLVQRELKKKNPRIAVLREWFGLPFSHEYPEFLRKVMSSQKNAPLVIRTLGRPNWASHHDLMEDTVRNILPAYIKETLQKKDASQLVKEDEEGLFEAFRKNIGRPLLLEPEKLPEADKIRADLREFASSKIEPEITLKERKFTAAWFHHPISREFPEIVKALEDRNNDFTDNLLVWTAYQLPPWKNPEVVMRNIKARKSIFEICIMVMRPHWADHPELVQALIDMDRLPEHYYMTLADSLSKPHWLKHPELITQLVDKNSRPVDRWLYKTVPNDFLLDHPELVRKVIEHKHSSWTVAEEIFPQPSWEKHPELLEQLIRTGIEHDEKDLRKILDEKVFPLAAWQESPALKTALGGKPLTYDNLEKVFKSGFTFAEPSHLLKSCASAFKAMMKAVTP